MDEELKQYLTAMEERLKAHVETHVDQRVDAAENRLVEKMRDMQSELLRGFRVFSGAQVIRLRKLEADQSNPGRVLVQPCRGRRKPALGNRGTARRS